ncbi:MAG: 16S rRNA (adenine(1518)-N(6)/adenine(1519)-N(6))-dimethyltransferase, partial [Firmicutes bacterium]|nr:16S rRNA (adenine(1518)-N(6)/adenine(1519)-N(6))-dimethyltransferase [Bacillota bacterium]
VIFHFLDVPGLVSVTVTVQKEVALRFCARENTRDYGAVTAQLKAYGDPKLTRTVPRAVFTPPPNVDSAVVHLKIQKKPGIQDFPLLKRLIAAAFSMRRKTLLNNLTAAFSLPKEKAARLLAAADLPENIRGEALSIEQFIKLSNLLYTQSVYI